MNLEHTSESALQPILSERFRITSSFAKTKNYGAVIVCAPAGSGKTTAVRHYVIRSAGSTEYFAFSASTSQLDLNKVLSAGRGACEIVIDDLDKAPDYIVNALVAHIRNDTSGSRFILTGRSRSRMRAHALVATGIATSIDAAALAFDNDETKQLADRLGLERDDEAIVQLLHETDGWAIAVAWLVRDSADAQRPLRCAFDTWRDGRGHVLLEFLASEYERDAAAYVKFKALLREGGVSVQADLERYEALGFPVTRTRASFRPYRILSKLERRVSEPAAERVVVGPALLSLNALGRFRCQIDGRELAFQRRRDRNVFTYVALAPEGRATREQLLSAFWGDTNRALATQGLRTTLSRIRSAIAQIVGPESVEKYFDSASDVRVDFSKMTFDVRRFTDHFQRARMDDARGDKLSAKFHYVAAAGLYRDYLLSSASIESCFSAQREDLESKYVETLDRLVKLYVAEADYEAAGSCARKLEERTMRVDPVLSRVALLDPTRATTAWHRLAKPKHISAAE